MRSHLLLVVFAALALRAGQYRYVVHMNMYLALCLRQYRAPVGYHHYAQDAPLHPSRSLAPNMDPVHCSVIQDPALRRLLTQILNSLALHVGVGTLDQIINECLPTDGTLALLDAAHAALAPAVADTCWASLPEAVARHRGSGDAHSILRVCLTVLTAWLMQARFHVPMTQVLSSPFGLDLSMTLRVLAWSVHPVPVLETSVE